MAMMRELSFQMVFSALKTGLKDNFLVRLTELDGLALCDVAPQRLNFNRHLLLMPMELPCSFSMKNILPSSNTLEQEVAVECRRLLSPKFLLL